jgi:hypothetical protein
VPVISRTILNAIVMKIDTLISNKVSEYQTDGKNRDILEVSTRSDTGMRNIFSVRYVAQRLYVLQTTTPSANKSITLSNIFHHNQEQQ